MNDFWKFRPLNMIKSYRWLIAEPRSANGVMRDATPLDAPRADRLPYGGLVINNCRLFGRFGPA